MNKNIPGWLLIEIVVAVSDFAGTFSKEWIVPHIVSENKEIMKVKDLLLTSGLSGLCTWILLDPVLGLGESPFASIGVGAVSSWGADYIFKSYYS
jgi:hypothetical protein